MPKALDPVDLQAENARLIALLESHSIVHLFGWKRAMLDWLARGWFTGFHAPSRYAQPCIDLTNHYDAINDCNLE